MVQHIVIALLFLAAVVYLGYLVYRNFRTRSGCSSGCGSCGVDFSSLEASVEKTLRRKPAR